MYLLRRIYSIYCFLLFVGLFLLIYPGYLLAIWVPGWWRLGCYTTRLWATLYFPLIGMPIKIEGKEHLKGIKGNAVFCVNHFSYLDIATMGFLPRPFVFIGKESIRKVPLFGYMFRKLHITVNRQSLKDRYATYQKSTRAVEQGKDLVIFPEGGIISARPPQMVKFKEGAFKSAIANGVPILPVTLPNNWRILPDNGQFLPKIRRCSMIIHEPIFTRDLSENDVPEIRDRCFRVIDSELRKHFPDQFEAGS